MKNNHDILLIDSGSRVNTIYNKLAKKLKQDNFKMTSRKILTANNSSLPIWRTADFNFPNSNQRGGAQIELKDNFNIVGK